MEEAENSSFLDMKNTKCFPGRSMARGLPKPYVSCIKINGVPILPPLLDESRRREMRTLRERAVAVERCLSLARQQRENSGDSGLALSALVSGEHSRSASLLESRYLSAVDIADDSVCSVYGTPGNGSSIGNTIEQRLAFSVDRRTSRPDQSERTEPSATGHESVCNEDARHPVNVPTGERPDNTPEKSPDSTTLTGSTDLNPYLDVTQEDIAIDSPSPESRQQDIGGAEGGATPITVGQLAKASSDLVRCGGSSTSGDASELGEGATLATVFSESQGPSRLITSWTDGGNASPRKEKAETVVSEERSHNLERREVLGPSSLDPCFSARSFEEPGDGGHAATSTPYRRVASLHDLAPPSGAQGGDHLRPSSSHTFGLVPPNVCLRPTVSINDWLLSSSRATVRSDPESFQEDSFEGSQRRLVQAVSIDETTKVFSKNYNDPEAGLDLEPSKLVIEVTSSVGSTASEAIPQQCLTNSVIELVVKVNESFVGMGSQDAEKQDEQCFSAVTAASLKSVLLGGESNQSTDHLPAALGDEAVPPLIRQHSFTVQTGPSNLLRSYVEENGMELNTGTFQNPKPTEPVAKCDTVSTGVVDKASRDGPGRKGWDLNRAKAMWVAGNNKLQPFAKPKTPATRLKKQVIAKHRTRSVPSVYCASSLPNSTRNSPEKSQEGYGSVDGLNYKSQTPQKKPRRSLHFPCSSPKSATKFADHVHTNKLGLSSQVQRRGLSLTTHSNKTVGLKTCLSNPLTVDWDKTGSNPCPSNSLKKVPLVIKPNETALSLQTIECPKENSNLTEQLLHLKTEHNKQMALLLEKQRAEQEKIQEMFMIQQRKLMEEMQRSYPDAFNSVTSLLDAESTQQTEEAQLTGQQSSRKVNLVRPHETAKLLQENVCTRNESSRKARWHNNSVSKENLASFLSVESLYEGDSNKENIEQFKHEKQPDFEGLTIESIPVNQSLPHLIISDSDLDILPCANVSENSNVGDHLMRSPDSSSHISKAVSTLSEEICNLDLDPILSPKIYKTTINVPTVYHNDSLTYQRNLQNSVSSNRSVENYQVHRSYETLVVHSSRENISSRNESGCLELSHSSLGRVRHSPRNSTRSRDDNEISSDYGNGVQRTYDTLHPSICGPPFLDFRPIRRPSKQEQLAASKIVAAAKGYLVRRLMKTELVQNMIATIAETLKTAIELRDEILNVGNVHMSPADLELRERLHNQLESEHQSLYALFVHSSEAHRVAVIAADRERIKTQLSRTSSGQRPLSSATQRSLKRKQEPEKHGPTPRSRPTSCRRSSRRPLWETSSVTARHRSCSGQAVPAWVVNSKPSLQQTRPPPPRKPWR